jgi:uncharacterized protein (TIGR02266 family)
MKQESPVMKDSLATFREYMGLERRRSSGLTTDEYRRWLLLRKRLDRVFGPLDATGCAARRATPRVATSIEVRFENLGEMGSALMSNISRGGIFVPMDRPPAIGTELKMRIRVASPPREIVLDGEVASRHVGPQFDVRQQGMGIRFKNLSPNDQALVDELYEQQVERHLADR